MRVVTDLPHEIVDEPDWCIPLSDGTRLAAHVWRPAGSEDQPVPAILELIPYRQADLTAVRDSMHHPYLAGDWDVRTETRTLLTCTSTTLVLDTTLDAFEGDRRVRSPTWSRSIPRDGV